jgi:hypothetical protein
MAAIKVYKMDDYDWWAGESLAACIEAARLECGAGSYDDAETEAVEITPEAMLTQMFWDDVTGKTHSFADQLAKEIADGTKFPCLFASTEY